MPLGGRKNGKQSQESGKKMGRRKDEARLARGKMEKEMEKQANLKVEVRFEKQKIDTCVEDRQ